ncbi:MAG TPA: hypothetical protein VI756_20115 [Blastocatellia bacterium]
MNTKNFRMISALLIALVVTCGACKQGGDAQPERSNAGGAVPSPAAPSPVPSPSPLTATAVAARSGGQGLSGTYIISEVDDNGNVTMIKPEDQILIIFDPPHSFSRTTKAQGKVVHTDAGDYRFEGADQLILSTTISDKEPLISPTDKTHKFDLSDDGDELKLWGTGDKVAVFRRQKAGQG